MTQPIVIGVDEAGRGALAGPLVVCATAFHCDTPIVTTTYHGLRGDRTIAAGDSKSFTNTLYREVLDTAIRKIAVAISIIEYSAQEIDTRLMHVVFPEALRLAIARITENLVQRGFGGGVDGYVVKLDGEMPPLSNIPCTVHAIPDGDKKIWQIGAASIVAKVYRDRRMDELHQLYPAWGFDTHRGYPTTEHKKLLKVLDTTTVHRRTFRPVAEAHGMPPGFEI